MRKLVVSTFVTLDGAMQAPGGPNGDVEGGFEHGGWQVPLFDDVVGKDVVEQGARGDAMLFNGAFGLDTET